MWGMRRGAEMASWSFARAESIGPCGILDRAIESSPMTVASQYSNIEGNLDKDGPLETGEYEFWQST